MSILSKPLLRPNQRFDLEDWEVLLSALRTDSKFWTSRFLSQDTYIIKGFNIEQAVLGQNVVLIKMEDSTLINANNSDDFSWFTTELAAPDIEIGFGPGSLQTGRNYIELELGTEEGTPLQRAFWDPSANSGEGIEFTQEVNTVTDLKIEASVSQIGFSPDPNKIPLAIIDTDGSVITGIQDKRELFFRLGNADTPQYSFLWNSRTESSIVLAFNSPSATPFIVGETVTFSPSGATAKVVVGGVNNIEVNLISDYTFAPGNTVVGSGTGVLNSYYEKFSGADKDIFNFRQSLEALMSEIKLLKGTNFWYELGPVLNLRTLLDYCNTFLTPFSAGAKFAWSGSALSITDSKTSGQATSDNIAAIRTLGKGAQVFLTRQDGTGGSSTIAISNGFVLYVELPESGNRTYSDFGAAATNFKFATIADFEPTDRHLMLAYREGSKLIVKGVGELMAGESIEIGDQISKEILAFIGASDDADGSPMYTTHPKASLSNQFTDGDALTQSISVNAANINDIAEGLEKVYYEPLDVISGAASNSYEITGPLFAPYSVTLPLNSRDGDTQKQYKVGTGALFVFRNGQMLSLGEDYEEVGVFGALSSEIDMLIDLDIGERLEFKTVTPEVFGTALSPQSFFLNYITGQNGLQIPTGALYNIGTGKLSVYRNGVCMIKTMSIGDLVDRYQEINNNSISIFESAEPTDVFTFLNREDPQPSVTLISGVTGTVLTVPSYVMGSERLMIYRNGLLLSKDASAPNSLKYSETSTTEITLQEAAISDDVFQVFIAGDAPSFRETLTGTTGTTITIPNGQSYTMGDQKLLVFRNGVLIFNSLALSTAAFRYQEFSTTQIELEEALESSDLLEFIYI